jgi:lysine biosynthesis protein LysW
MGKEIKGKCPSCGEIIEIDEYYEVDDEVICNDCGDELIIERINPLKLRVVRRLESIDDEDSDIDEDDN